MSILSISPTNGAVAKPTRGIFYHPELDVLRFAAFVLVFISHADYDVFDPRWAHIQAIANFCFALHGAGFAGVALFFSLSAYLITELLLQEQERTGTIHFKAFYTRRILRIWPLYFFFLLVVRPLAHHWLPWEHFSASDYAAFLLLVGNWQCIVTGWPPSVAAPLWSISIEEQFYLLWPLLVARFRNRIPAVALSMLLLANLMRIAMIVHPLRDTGIWYNTFARLDPFAFGALLAYYTHNRVLMIGRGVRLLMIAFGIQLLLLIGRWGDHTDSRAILSYPIESFACALLLAATLLPMHTWTPGPVGRCFVYFGRVSYGLYVYHLFVMKLILLTPVTFWWRQVLAFGGTLALAALSYAALEKPFLRMKQLFTYVPSRL